MKEIIKRNKFTILLGLVLAIIFAIIIVLSQRRDSNFLLTPAKINETFRVGTESNDQTDQQENNTNTQNNEPIIPGGVDEELVADSTVVKPVDRVDEVVANMDPVQIEFTAKNGFIPKDTTAVEDQRLVWTNSSDRIIEIIQVIEKYENLPETVEVGPGQSYGIQLTEPKNWSYREVESNFVGTIYIYPKKSSQN